jgi:uncharacterized coiled-coil DUF342 family protein
MDAELSEALEKMTKLEQQNQRLKSDIIYLEQERERMELEVVNYRNSVRYMNDLLTRHFSNFSGMVKEYNERKKTIESIERDVRHMGFIRDFKPLQLDKKGSEPF